MVNGEDDNQVMDEVSTQVHSTILSALGIQYALFESTRCTKAGGKESSYVPDRVIAASPCGRSFDGSLSTPEWHPFRAMSYGGPLRHKIKFVFCDSSVRLFIFPRHR